MPFSGLGPIALRHSLSTALPFSFEYWKPTAFRRSTSCSGLHIQLSYTGNPQLFGYNMPAILNKVNPFVTHLFQQRTDLTPFCWIVHYCFPESTVSFPVSPFFPFSLSQSLFADSHTKMYSHISAYR